MKTKWIVCCALLASCAPTETGNPPLTPPGTGLSDDFVVGGVSGPTSCGDAGAGTRDDAGTDCVASSHVIIQGNTLDAPEARSAWFFALDSATEASVFPVTEDGLFRAEFVGLEPGVLRIQLRGENTYFAPFDFEVVDSVVTAVAHPDAGCLDYASTIQASESGFAKWTIASRCTRDLPVSLGVRGMSGDVSIEGPDLVAAGGSTTFEIRIHDDEAIAFVMTGDAPDERIAIHVLAQ